MIEKENSNSYEKGWNFNQYCASIYESLGYKTTVNINIGPQQIDILAERHVSGIGLIKIIVECKYLASGNVSNQEVIDFISLLNAIRDTHGISKGVLVTNRGFTEKAVNAAAGSVNVELINSESLENHLFDLNVVLHNYVEDYKIREIFSSYVPLSAKIKYWDKTRPKDAANIQDEIAAGINSLKYGFYVVLGDFGSGKTTLMERLKFDFAKKYLSGSSALKPMMILLKDYYKHQNIESLLQKSIIREFNRDIPLPVFWRALNSGKMLLLLDGFDEMVSHADLQSRNENFLILSKLIATKSPAVLTCRPSYFISEEEISKYIKYLTGKEMPMALSSKLSKSKSLITKAALAAKIKLRIRSKIDRDELRTINPFSDQGSIIVHLSEFSSDQINTYLQNHDQSFQEVHGKGWEFIRDLLSSIYDLSDLMSRPILLMIIKETVLTGQIDLEDAHLTLGPSTLYDIYTSTQFERDWEKGESRRQLSKEQRKSFAIAIALGMFEKEKPEIQYAEILKIIKQRFKEVPNYSGEEAATDIQISTFLSRHVDGYFRFSHKSFMEYFVALYLKGELQGGRKDDLFDKQLPKEILYFLGGFGISEPNVSQIIYDQLLKSSSAKDGSLANRIGNLAGALFYSGPEIKNRNFRFSHVNSINIKKVRLTQVKMKDFIFRNIEFRDFSVYDSELESIQMIDCDATEWSICNSQLICGISKSNFRRLLISGHSVLTMSCGDVTLTAGRCEDSKVNYLGNCQISEFEFSRCLISFSNDLNPKFKIMKSKFLESTLNVAEISEITSIIIENCSFIRCTFSGILVSKLQIEVNSFEECKGFILVEDIGYFMSRKSSIEKQESKFPFMRINDLLLFPLDHWRKADAKSFYEEMLKNYGV